MASREVDAAELGGQIVEGAQVEAGADETPFWGTSLRSYEVRLEHKCLTDSRGPVDPDVHDELCPGGNSRGGGERTAITRIGNAGPEQCKNRIRYCWGRH